MRCTRCGESALALHNTLCTTCYTLDPTTGQEKLEALAKKPRKPKSNNKLEANVLTYLTYVIEHPDLDKFNKKDFEKLMDIPVTSVNYLIKVLKKRQYIVTIGKRGAQAYVPNRDFLVCIVINLVRIRGQLSLDLSNGMIHNEKFTI